MTAQRWLRTRNGISVHASRAQHAPHCGRFSPSISHHHHISLHHRCIRWRRRVASQRFPSPAWPAAAGSRSQLPLPSLPLAQPAAAPHHTSQCRLVPARPAAADGRSRARTLSPPPPRTVEQPHACSISRSFIWQLPLPRQSTCRCRCRCLVLVASILHIGVPAVEVRAHNLSPPS